MLACEGLAASVLAVAVPAGATTNDVVAAVNDVKGGKIAFKVDKVGIIHASIGRVSFSADKIEQNSHELINAIMKLKPSSSKGTYVQTIYLSSTMSPSVNIDKATVAGL